MQVLSLALATFTSLAAGSTPAPADRDLTARLDAWYARAARVAPGAWGIAIATLDGQLIWGIQPGRPMIPASTVKLFTTGFARSVLGGEARKHTRVIGQGQLDQASGRWIGSWALELNGDPTLERSAHGGPTLAELASQLATTGIRKLFGPLNLVSADGRADASYPDVWSPRHRGRTFAPLIGALTINENVLSVAVAPGAAGKPARLVSESPAGAGELVQIRATTVTGRNTRLGFSRAANGGFVISGHINARSRTRWFTSTSYDPRALLEASWARALRQAGIEWVRADVISGPTPGLPVVLAAVRSEPFDSIASEVNRRSSNLGAELLLRWAAGTGDPGAQLTEHVRQITGELTGVRLVDGSGLSRDDRATPLSFISYLTRFPLLPAGRGFFQLLPSNGVGTLRKLAVGLPAPGVVRAKTGTLGDVATLAGYLGHPDGVLVISLMYNGARASRARQEQWKLFRLLGAEGVAIPGDSLGAGSQLGGEDRGQPVPPN